MRYSGTGFQLDRAELIAGETKAASRDQRCYAGKGLQRGRGKGGQLVFSLTFDYSVEVSRFVEQVELPRRPTIADREDPRFCKVETRRRATERDLAAAGQRGQRKAELRWRSIERASCCECNCCFLAKVKGIELKRVLKRKDGDGG